MRELGWAPGASPRFLSRVSQAVDCEVHFPTEFLAAKAASVATVSGVRASMLFQMCCQIKLLSAHHAHVALPVRAPLDVLPEVYPIAQDLAAYGTRVWSKRPFYLKTRLTGLS